MKVFENILCAARLHYAADVLLGTLLKNDKSGSASCAARLTSLIHTVKTFPLIIRWLSIQNKAEVATVTAGPKGSSK